MSAKKARVWLSLWLWCAELADNENIIEVHVAGAELQCGTGANFASFVELNFFDHATQATPIVPGNRSVLACCSHLNVCYE